ncbi:hypothetical protein T4E_2036 [Trichinella pseudospiralis]|uniref:Uncharacterized protein n=1 Tax=Trichinella pseudospiralis TaxID=6337 RepID=A0A0V1FP86_TRIPS|nr:hypothetical protein T4E_2036 [Trichinella pseudospiralis]KRY87830.1 hypothetical protein T4D_10528 [Trichinella pseudospiralis]
MKFLEEQSDRLDWKKRLRSSSFWKRLRKAEARKTGTETFQTLVKTDYSVCQGCTRRYGRKCAEAPFELLLLEVLSGDMSPEETMSKVRM